MKDGMHKVNVGIIMSFIKSLIFLLVCYFYVFNILESLLYVYVDFELVGD